MLDTADMFLKFFCFQRTVKIETLHKGNPHFHHFPTGFLGFYTFCTKLDAQVAAKVAETFKKDLIVSILADVLNIFPVYFNLGDRQPL